MGIGMKCVFCDICNQKKEAYVIYESETVVAFLDSSPLNEGHVLIVPKEHYVDLDEIPDELMEQLIYLAKQVVVCIKEKYHPDGYSIMQNGGACNDVGHFHLHVFPRYRNDGFGWLETNTKAVATKQTAEQLKVLLHKRMEELTLQTVFCNEMDSFLPFEKMEQSETYKAVMTMKKNCDLCWLIKRLEVLRWEVVRHEPNQMLFCRNNLEELQESTKLYLSIQLEEG